MAVGHLLGRRGAAAPSKATSKAKVGAEWLLLAPGDQCWEEVHGVGSSQERAQRGSKPRCELPWNLAWAAFLGGMFELNTIL